MAYTYSTPKPRAAIKGKPGVEGLGERLQCVRRMRNMAQADLAERIDVTGMQISHWECGRQHPSAANIRALSIALNVSADYLLDCAR